MFKKLLITLLLTFLSTQASAFVSKGFVPANVSKINVGMNDHAKGGCWTNISEVKRYTEDKLELIGFNIPRDKFETYDDKNHFVFGVTVTANRTNGRCYGQIGMYIMKHTYENNVHAKFVVGEYGSIFTGYDNVNQMTLELVGDFMKEVEDPQW